MGKYSAEDRWRYVALYDSGQSIDYCAKQANVTFATMKENLQRWGAKMRRRGPPRKHMLNERYFQNIYNQERAYWLGFVRAHGCTGKTGAGNRFLRVELALQDASHLSQMATCLGYTGSIQYNFAKGRHGSAYLTLNSTSMVKDLEAQESLSEVAPGLLHHFLRGFCDGRGQLLDNGAFYVYLVDCKTDTDMCRRLVDRLGMETAAIHESAGWWSVREDSIVVIERVLRQLYTDSQIYLLRKKLEADEFLGD